MLTEQQREWLREVEILARDRDRSIQQVLASVSEARSRLAPLVAFVHIPKTAGGTVTNMLNRAYPRAAVLDLGNFIADSDKAISKVTRPRVSAARVAVGHIPYAILREHLPQDTRYITFLREPLARVLSNYYQHIHRTGTPKDKVRPVVADSIEEALERRLPQVSNFLTRFLCGPVSATGDLPATALDDAKANLRGFAFVGLQERFDQSLVLLQRTLGLGLVPYESRHVGRPRLPDLEASRPTVDELSDDQRALILDANSLDVGLYAFAQELFDKRVADQDEDPARDAKRLRDLSAALDDEEMRRFGEWLESELPLGTAKPRKELRPAAIAAGISPIATNRVQELPGVEMVRDEEGYWVWRRTRTPE